MIASSAPTCSGIRSTFSEYLDGAISGRDMSVVADHLKSCEACRAEFTVWRGMQQVLASVGTMRAPEDLGLKLRLAISHENAKRQGHWWDGLNMRWENLLRPMLVQFSAGLAGAVLLIGSIVLLVGVVATPLVLANDEPLGAMTTPHYLYSAAGQQPVVTSGNTTIVVEADINAAGSVYNYTIVSGPIDEATQIKVRNQLLVQVYEPARVFGEPVRGRVLITFAGISVTG